MRISDLCCSGRVVSVLEGGYGCYSEENEVEVDILTGVVSVSGSESNMGNMDGGGDTDLETDVKNKVSSTYENVREQRMDRQLLAAAAAAHVRRLVDPYGPSLVRSVDSTASFSNLYSNSRSSSGSPACTSTPLHTSMNTGSVSGSGSKSGFGSVQGSGSGSSVGVMSRHLSTVPGDCDTDTVSQYTLSHLSNTMSNILPSAPSSSSQQSHSDTLTVPFPSSGSSIIPDSTLYSTETEGEGESVGERKGEGEVVDSIINSKSIGNIPICDNINISHVQNHVQNTEQNNSNNNSSNNNDHKNIEVDISATANAVRTSTGRNDELT